MHASETALSERDARLVTALTKAGVFQKVKRDQLEGNHTIVVMCGDCRHSGDIVDHHRRICGHAPHILSLNGGSLLIPMESPLHGARARGKVLIEDVVESVKLKGITRVVLYAHTVCGKAHGVNVKFLDSVRLHIAAKQRVKGSHLIRKRLKEHKLDLFCFHHLFFPNGDRKTMFVSRPHWEAFLKDTHGMNEEGMLRHYGV